MTGYNSEYYKKYYQSHRQQIIDKNFYWAEKNKEKKKKIQQNHYARNRTRILREAKIKYQIKKAHNLKDKEKRQNEIRQISAEYGKKDISIRGTQGRQDKISGRTGGAISAKVD